MSMYDMNGTGPSPTSNGDDLQLLISTVQAAVQAINGLNQTLQTVFPQQGSTAATAGAVSKYLNVVVDDVSYKIALLAP